MKKILGLIAAGVLICGGILGQVQSSVFGGGEVYASEGAVILSDCWEKADSGDGKGGIFCVLQIGLDILTAVVGILGVIGIVVVGLQYLTAGGNEAQMTKAKKRMLEIIIGLVVYALAFVLLKWLLPNFESSTSFINTGEVAVLDETIAGRL